jgi:tRNA(Arg) A34 adenosine deaminase TadA
MKLGTEHLVDTTIYVLAHPCPMCLGSLYYCSPKEVIFGDHMRVLRSLLR